MKFQLSKKCPRPPYTIVLIMEEAFVVRNLVFVGKLWWALLSEKMAQCMLQCLHMCQTVIGECLSKPYMNGTSIREFYTVNREYFVSKTFHAIIFRVKLFSDKWPCTALSLILRLYFVRLIFAQAMLSKNILTSKYSRFTVVCIMVHRSQEIYALHGTMDINMKYSIVHSHTWAMCYMYMYAALI